VSVVIVDSTASDLGYRSSKIGSSALLIADIELDDIEG